VIYLFYLSFVPILNEAPLHKDVSLALLSTTPW